MSLRGAIFDFDGLILDTESAEFVALGEVYRRHGATLEFKDYSICIGTANAFDPVSHLEGLLGRRIDRTAVAAEMHKAHMENVAEAAVFPGVVERLEEGRVMGIKMGVASSSSGNWVENHLREKGLRGYFDEIVVRSDTLPAKPAPDLYLVALSRLGLRADEAVAIEDSVHGIEAAKKAGIFCLAVPNELTRRMDMSGADLVVASLNEITLARLAGMIGAAQRGR